MIPPYFIYLGIKMQKITQDKQGNHFFTSYAPQSNAVMMFANQNTKFLGKPKISARVGKNSKFGNEIIFEFLIEKVEDVYETNNQGNYENFEWYLPLEEGYEFFKETYLWYKQMLNIEGENMSWKEIEYIGEYWKPIEENDTIVGVIESIEEGDYGKLYSIKEEDSGQVVKLPSHKILNELLKETMPKQRIKIVYKGSTKCKKSDELHLYKVFIWNNE